jgi:hypothetical protein
MEKLATDLVPREQNRCLTGKSTIFRPAPFAKIFRFPFDPNHLYIVSRPIPHKGRIAIVTDAGWDAMDAGGASDEGAVLRTEELRGPDAPTLASSPREAKLLWGDGGKKAGHRGERRGSR